MRQILIGLCAIIVASSAWAGNEAYGDWVVDKSSNIFQVAKTQDTDGNVTGMMCFLSTGSCAPYLKIKNPCEPGSAYPMMLNSSIGADSVTANCEKVADMLLFSFSADAAKIISAFASGGGSIGFAFPLKDARFISYRFSTSGASMAIESAKQYPRSKQDAPQNKLSPTVF